LGSTPSKPSARLSPCSIWRKHNDRPRYRRRAVTRERYPTGRPRAGLLVSGGDEKPSADLREVSRLHEPSGGTAGAPTEKEFGSVFFFPLHEPSGGSAVAASKRPKTQYCVIG